MLVQLDTFKGPFDLLVRLIEKNEIDIYDIPIAKLTYQYLEAIRQIPPDMDEMSEFLVMAATLLEIKSRMLLPRPSKINEEEEEDPRESLVRQLIAYKHCQELAEALKGIESSGKRLFKKAEYPLMANKVSLSPEERLTGVTIDRMWEIFTDVVQRQSLKVDTVRHNFGTVARDRYTITDKVKQIKSYLRTNKKLLLSELFEDCSTRSECVVIFLALLEMIKLKQVTVCQENLFDEIEVQPCPA